MRKRSLVVFGVMLLVCASIAYAWHTEPRDMVYTGNQVFEKAVTFSLAPTFTSGLTSTTAPTMSALTASKPVFTDASKALTSSGTMPVAQGGTGLTSYAIGDILYASAATTISKLAGVAAGQPLLSGGVATAPAYAGYTFSGTAGQTYTFPTTTATLARTDAANTFTGTQTFSGSIVATNIETALSATTIALNADGNTTLYTVPAGKRAVLTKAVLVVGADAGSTDFTIGQAGALTDFLGTQQCDNLNAQYDAGIFMPVPNATAALIKSYAAGTVIKAAVANQAGGATNTLYLFGFLY